MRVAEEVRALKELRHRSLRIEERSAGMRADVFLSLRFADWSRSSVARAIRTGEVTSSERRLKPGTTLRAGEVLRIAVPELAGDPVEKPPPPPLLHQDPRLLAYAKPAGLLMHPVGRAFAWGLINLAREQFPGEELHLAHRLDRETSGVVLIARDPEMNRQLKADFKARRIQKTYWAIVRGHPSWERTRVEASIGDDTASPIRLKMGTTERGQSACTELRVLGRFRRVSLVSCRPLTGRTHQIRLHLASVGHPIVGDRIYGQPPEVFLSLYEKRPCPGLRALLGHPRHCLHARALHLSHPDGGLLSLRAPLPADMAALLRRS